MATAEDEQLSHEVLAGVQVAVAEDASLLPGFLAATRTELPPVGDDELVIVCQAKGLTSNWAGRTNDSG